MSDLDELLLEALQKDGRKSYTELADMFNANVSTVSNRVQKMIDQGVLKIVGVVNPFKTGKSFVADIKMKVAISELDEVISQLQAIPEIRFIAACTGSYNLIIEVYTASNNELYELIREKLGKIKGIEGMETSILLEVHKQSYDFGVKLNKKMNGK